jgi:hypothetical protein
MPPVVINKIIRSRRRTIALQILPDGSLIVRAPHRVPLPAIHEIVGQKSSWIEKKQEWLRTKYKPPVKIEFPALYRQQAFTYISQRAKVLAETLNFEYQKLSITNATTRWGSCSGKKTINFSWRLILTPVNIIDYVIIHELVHLKEPNHARGFWQKVAELFPDYREARRWLKDNHHLLNA